MRWEIVKRYFEEAGLGERVKSLSHASGTVEQAAEAIGCEPKQIAKTMSFLVNDMPVLIVTAGDAKVYPAGWMSARNGLLMDKNF